jgi:hypothetical protein
MGFYGGTLRVAVRGRWWSQGGWVMRRAVFLAVIINQCQCDGRMVIQVKASKDPTNRILEATSPRARLLRSRNERACGVVVS